MADEQIKLVGEDIDIKVRGNIATITCADPMSSSSQLNVRTVSVQGLLAAFKSQTTDIKSPVLPIGTVKYHERGSQVKLFLFHEPARFNARYGSHTYQNCVRPAILMVYTLNFDGKNYAIANTHAYAVKEPSSLLLTGNTELFRMPFPNFYPDGRICWGSGSNTGLPMQSLSGLKSYVERLFSAPFNSDLFESSLLSPLGISSPGELFKQLRDQEEYPDKLYLPFNTKMILGGISQ